jgi:hypothetical protein
VGYVFGLYPRQCGAAICRNLLSFPKRKLGCRWTWLSRLTLVVCRVVAQPGHRAVLVELFASGGVFQLSSGRRSCSAGRRLVTFPRSALPMDAHKAVIASALFPIQRTVFLCARIDSSTDSDGTLTSIGVIDGLPKTVGFNGIAAL